MEQGNASPISMDFGLLEIMNRRIFLDVGANTGQTLGAVLDPAFGFDQITCFEPAPECWHALNMIAKTDARVGIIYFGLWNQTGSAKIFEPGRKGASLWRKDGARSDASRLCKFIRASDWFRENIFDSDIVWLKLNVEGAECDILDDLLDSGEFAKVTFCMVDFDVRKIASQKHREAELRARLAPFGFPRVCYGADRKRVMVGDTHQERIKSWLRAIENAK